MKPPLAMAAALGRRIRLARLACEAGLTQAADAARVTLLGCVLRRDGQTVRRYESEFKTTWPDLPTPPDVPAADAAVKLPVNLRVVVDARGLPVVRLVRGETRGGEEF